MRRWTASRRRSATTRWPRCQTRRPPPSAAGTAISPGSPATSTDGKPFDACSRGILKRQTEAAAALGYTFNLGIETEFFLFKDTPDGGFAPISERDDMAKPCYDPRLLMDNLPIVDELVQAMNEMGWGVYSFDHEDANGQFETDFKYTDALGMADRFVFFRMMANEIARKHGAFATFMPKPRPTAPAAARTTTCRSPTSRPARTCSKSMAKTPTAAA